MIKDSRQHQKEDIKNQEESGLSLHLRGNIKRNLHKDQFQDPMTP